MTTTRRLAAILAADVAGYSAAMERDEEGTATAVRALRREVIEPKLAEHQGRLIKTTGDGFLAEFASPIAALKCALAIQQRPDESSGLRLRIGLNLGDVIIEESGDILGEGVNIAARLEGLAEPGGILISSKIYSEVEGKVQAAFEDRGEQKVKSISRPVRVYAVRTSASLGRTSVTDPKPLPLPDTPSIAVLPFQNMSGDPEQEYFADGMVEEIITALSRFKQLFVIARNSSFTYKGKAVDIKQVGRELGVRYVLEGSVRKAGGRVRITGQLIEAGTGVHLWADRFEGAMEDVFDLQDMVTGSVVGAIMPKLGEAELAVLKRKAPDSWSSYDHYLRGKTLLLSGRGLSTINEAELELQKARELDPGFAPAYGWAAYAKQIRRNRQITLTSAEIAEAKRLAERAVELAPDDGEVLAVASAAIANVSNEIERGGALADRAVLLNPNASIAWMMKGWTSAYRNEMQQALDAFDRTIRLNPFDREMVWYAQFGKSWVCGVLGRHEEALAWAQQMIAQQPNNLTALMMLEAAYFDGGKTNEAKVVVDRMRATHPEIRASWLRQTYRRSAHASLLALIDQAIDRYGYPE